MNTQELQNSIIRKILNIKDDQFLSYFDKIISVSEKNTEVYELTAFEKQLVNESLEDYKQGKVLSNKDVFNKTEKWLEE